MNKILVIIIFLTLALSLHSSEFLVPLKTKVNESSLVSVVEVTSVNLGKIDKHNGQSFKTQHVEIKLKIKKTIYGEAEKEILLNCYASSFTDGSISQISTAGFSTYGISKGKKYIAYLTKKNNSYFLPFSSNQYLEEIDAKNQKVTDIGQTYKTIPLKEKIEKLLKLSKEKTEKKGNQKTD